MKLRNKNWGFAILIAIFMVGFLLVLVIWVFNLILRDMKDNRWSENYIKAYAGAEWAMELWLLEIKNEGYAIDKDLEKTSLWAEILSFETNFEENTDPKISYDMNIATDYYSWSIDKWETMIVPLFLNLSGVKKPTFNNLDNSNIIWNIIWVWEWMSWTWNFDYNTTKKYRQNSISGEINYSTESINDFLQRNEINYLVIFNKWNSSNYELKVPSWELFSKPKWSITSSVQVWQFKQNITTNIDNTEFLKMLKYSLYSK